jgi:hypothetical protein
MCGYFLSATPSSRALTTLTELQAKRDLTAISRNPRRAYDKKGQEIAPATMANIREQGINTLWATCQRIGCGHEAKIGVHAPTGAGARAGCCALPGGTARPGHCDRDHDRWTATRPGRTIRFAGSVSAPKASAEPVPASQTRPAPEPGSGSVSGGPGPGRRWVVERFFGWISKTVGYGRTQKRRSPPPEPSFMPLP